MVCCVCAAVEEAKEVSGKANCLCLFSSQNLHQRPASLLMLSSGCLLWDKDGKYWVIGCVLVTDVTKAVQILAKNSFLYTWWWQYNGKVLWVAWDKKVSGSLGRNKWACEGQVCGYRTNKQEILDFCCQSPLLQCFFLGKLVAMKVFIMFFQNNTFPTSRLFILSLTVMLNKPESNGLVETYYSFPYRNNFVDLHGDQSEKNLSQSNQTMSVQVVLVGNFTSEQ